MEVEVKSKRVVALPKAAPVESALPEGAGLAKDIVNAQLRAVRDLAKSQRVLDGEAVKALKDMTSVYETLAKIERDERRSDALLDRLSTMTDEQLDELERELRGKKR